METTPYYAYNTLSEMDKIIYKELLYCIDNLKDESQLSTLEPDKISYIFSCVMADHPEIFYVSGFKYTTYYVGDTVKRLMFHPCYSLDMDLIPQYREQIEEQVLLCMQNMPETKDEYIKAKYFFEYIITNTDYEMDCEQNQNIYSTFVNGVSVCQGYAKALQYLFQRAGMESLLITGDVSGESHAWNLVKVNGDYYYADPTWGDASYTFSNGGSSFSDAEQPINYDYFLVTSNDLRITHAIQNDIELPECVEIKDNYFVREGLYVDSNDKARYREIFSRIYNENQRCISIKCSDFEVFKAVKNELITQQGIFDYLRLWDDTIAYTDNEKQLTISFWI